MYLSEFWSNHGKDIIVSSVFILISIVLLISLIVTLGRNNASKKMFLLGGLVLAFLLVGVSYGLVRDYQAKLLVDPEIVFPIARLLLFNGLVIIIFAIFGYLFTKKRDIVEEKISVSTVAILGLLVALATVLMLFGIPIIPAFSFLKVEVSALIYFMVFLWFGMKPTIAVILLTNIIHAILPSITPPMIPLLDEMSNVVAVLVFLLPSFITFRNLKKDESPALKYVIMTSSLGALLTTGFMVLYNYYFNLPIVFNWPWEFKDVISVFGLFNFVKWGVVALVTVLLYRKLYDLKSQIVV